MLAHIEFFTASPKFLPIATLVIAALIIILIIWIFRLQHRLKKILVGKNSFDLEDSVHALSLSLKEFHKFTKDMEEYLVTVETRLKKSIQAVETIRFNPFKGTGSGGNNSFSSAFINEKGEGVILTGLYARDRVSIFAKPVKNFKSEFELAEEEEEAVKNAQKNLKA